MSQVLRRTHTPEFPLLEKKSVFSPKTFWGIIRNSELDVHEKHRCQRHGVE